MIVSTSKSKICIIVIFNGQSSCSASGDLYLRWKVVVSTMILLDREKDSVVNNMRSGRYRGLQTEKQKMKVEKKGEKYYVNIKIN